MQPVSCAGCQALQRRLRDLQAENERLRRQLDEATRAGKRQAAPFAKGQPADQPKKPGRKPGRAYGTKAHRQPPSPEQIDEVHEAVLVQREQEFCLRESSEVLGTTTLSNHVVQVAGWPSTAA
jgi:transposase